MQTKSKPETADASQNRVLTIEGGLIVEKNGKQCAGYIFNFSGHGAFDPVGKLQVDGRDATQEEIDAHNALLAKAELEAMKKAGRGVLYLTGENGHYVASQWSGGFRVEPYHVRQSFHNMAGRNGRTDAWFSLDGSRWHGVNIGDNQILRVRRCKR